MGPPRKWRGPHDLDSRASRIWEQNNENDSHRNWVRTSRTFPCPVCGKPDWCGVTADGRVVRCMRVESAQESSGGWLHSRGVSVPPSPIKPRQTMARTLSLLDLSAMNRRWIENARRRPGAFEEFAHGLGLDPFALACYGVGWTGREWSFPMFDAEHQCIGIRLRRQITGRPDAKYSVRGGKEGLFLPVGIAGPRELFITEGPTDACAVFQRGIETIGRPNCQGGAHLVAKLAHGRDVVVVADNDRPGIEGAQCLAELLQLHAKSVRLLLPPPHYKDVREWLQAEQVDYAGLLERCTPSAEVDIR